MRHDENPTTAQATIYGSKTDEPSERIERRLVDLNIPYLFVDVRHDPQARDWVAEWSGGTPKIPLVVFGAGERPRLIQPSMEELDEMLTERGLSSRSSAYLG
ncbi:MAG: mycoredoxin [Fimbriimonadaceae bacterium]|jgi:hypothetical protein|nr:mycoredoxin [Fimbriimonadaceae bacterium]